MSDEVAKMAPTQVQSVQPEGSALISMIERAARDPSVDIDKMERLFQMHERVEAKQREAAFNTAMAAAQEELRPVARKLRNSQTNSNYADLAAISEAADPVIHKHGFGVIASEFTSAIPQHIGVRLKVTHSAGHSEAYYFNIPLDGTGLKGNANKTATHAYASTITYGRRYAKCAVFDIATKNDTDGNQPTGSITPDQTEELAKLITATCTDIQAVLDFHKVESLSDMTAADYRTAKAKLVARKVQLDKEAANAFA
jgi:ribosomal protein S5